MYRPEWFIHLLLWPHETDTEEAYDEGTAMLSLYFSKASYCDLDSIRSWSCPSCVGIAAVCNLLAILTRKGFQTTLAIETGFKIQLYVGYHAGSNRIVASFRGSSNIPNWIQNIKTYLVDSPFADCGGDQNCRVHAGFIQNYNEIAPQVIDHILSLSRAHNAPVLVTGHSLGGAMALLTGLDLAVHDESIIDGLSVYTFGEPRVGNDEFSDFIRSKVKNLFRVVHNSDIVPRLPPQEGLGLFDFHHEPREVWYPDGQSYHICDVEGEDPSCVDGISVLKLSISDHLSYLGMSTSCNAPGTQTVVDPSWADIEWDVKLHMLAVMANRTSV